ncbi:sugar transferase [Sporosarcina sp. FSL W8-0480]|uniref:sugar transferase n=1 Tax=Sporosarcina sp. FSL W8-0480 TaxID=2954701 RepID=UPI0030D8C9B6
MYRKFFKRAIDLVVSLMAIILLSPILLLVAFLVKTKLGSPILFKQERPGLNEKKFTMYKFRTMTNEKDKNGVLLSNEDRLTGFGRFLRSTSLDELPELINVIKGEMSLVGPRPLLVEYLSLYNKEQARRHNVKPGITGWAQINGRNAVSWNEKFDYDNWYVDNYNLFIDIKIIIVTLKKVFVREGIQYNSNGDTNKFKGNKI